MQTEMLIDILLSRIDKSLFKKHFNSVTKEQINSFLTLEDNNLKKNELVEIAVEKIYGNEFLMIKFYTEFKYIFALTPTELEEILGCTKTERVRWTEEKLLKVVEYRKFEKYRQIIEYPVFDRLQIYSIIEENIFGWRMEYEKIKNKNKQDGVKKAVETRKVHENMRVDFKKKLNKLLVSWYKLDGKLAVTFELAFWTVWISRWAKENQEKAYNAIKNKELYLKQKEYLYELKNNAVRLLLKSDYANQSFYRPVNHKKEKLQLCNSHYDLWKEIRDNTVYMDKWDFFDSMKKEILKCSLCKYDSGNEYYSLFYLEIKSERIKDYKFSFHMPYNLGVSMFRHHNEIPMVEHIENDEGMFRFGRSIFEQEKIIYREKDVIRKFQEAMEKYKLYYPVN